MSEVAEDEALTVQWFASGLDGRAFIRVSARHLFRTTLQDLWDKIFAVMREHPEYQQRIGHCAMQFYTDIKCRNTIRIDLSMATGDDPDFEVRS